MPVYWLHINSRNYQKKLVMTLRPVYTYRHRLRLHARHHQSEPFCQWKWTVWWADLVQNPFSPSNSPSPFTQCKFEGHRCGTCKQAHSLKPLWNRMYYYFLFWLFLAGENAIGEDCWYNGGFVSHGEVVPDRDGCGTCACVDGNMACDNSGCVSDQPFHFWF